MDKRKLYRDLAHDMVDIAVAELSELAHDYVESLFPQRDANFQTAKELRERDAPEEAES